MSCYISSNGNRFYAATESRYGVAPVIQSANRIPAVKLKAKQSRVTADRKDKTGSRTFAGIPAGVRKQTTFGLNTYMTAWSDQTREPGHGPMIAAAMGSAAQIFSGATIASANGTLITFTAPHGLSTGQAIAVGGEIRFVASLASPSSVNINVPFTGTVVQGSAAAPTATYRLATRLPSVSIFDYWSPTTAVSRLLSGSAVDKFSIKVNGDFHEFDFTGGACDLVDSASFTTGQAGLQQFPAEPDTSSFDYTIIPGHLGQAWIGSVPNQFFTLTSAQVQLNNNLDLRNREFGSDVPRCIVGGVRNVSTDFTLFAQDNDATAALYTAARQMSPMSVMLQLGQQPQELFGIYLKSVMPEVPEFDDSETRLQWTFKGNRAQGVSNDELVVAFA